jgi:sugar-specific transcriptional regulator TrmB
MYKDILVQLGINQNEATIYEYLLKNGEKSAGEIIKKTPLKRGLVYLVLGELVKKGLILEKKKRKVAFFSPAHPQILEERLTNEEASIKKAKLTLEVNLPMLISDFNLISGQPGVRYFEGIEGIKKVLDDTLKNNAEKKIRTFSDVAGIADHLADWNTRYYAPKRLELNIHEQVIIPNIPRALEYMKDYKANMVTEILFINHELFPFTTEVNIYDGKVSFVTFSEKSLIGVIIKNEEIYRTLVSIFDLTWISGKLYSQNIQPAWLGRH